MIQLIKLWNTPRGTFILRVFSYHDLETCCTSKGYDIYLPRAHVWLAFGEKGLL